MYAEKAHVKDNPVKVRLNDEDFLKLAQLSNAKRVQRAVLARELLLAGLRELERQNELLRQA